MKTIQNGCNFYPNRFLKRSLFFVDAKVKHIEPSATFNNYKNNCTASSRGLEATKLQTLSRK
ncbi:hypothetical protein HMPREF0444_0660 [Granulicatella adiacens ATCC 49175]|uniref:Uncharacterized protein n=1 Tax=Granulicatella adiacens ATCC 49175 TaxID=638301 RepID=C8NFG5_9LACT|nr:hypothetical protein HMPREF0444_0660 [Granulicatella adiacens ATCC 49175]